MDTWNGHWHGYAWTGSGRTYFAEWTRRPGPSARDAHTLEFIASPVPPMMTGHWLLKRKHASADRTWTDPAQAVAWLTDMWEQNPPARDLTYLPLEDKLPFWRDTLPRGVDVTVTHWARGGHLASFSVVCCANRFHPQIPCPLPPVTRTERTREPQAALA